ncbi:prephenate dehydrogenase/arogenate dehydrogenase family protein [Endozoicomonas sp. 2B-B]
MKKVERVVIEQNKTGTPLNILVVGLGLIGGSFAASLRECSENFHLMGFDLKGENIQAALSLGIVAEGCTDFESAVSKADVILLSVPMLAMPKLLRQLKGLDLTDKVMTDVGSCKGILVQAAREIFDCVPENLVPGHPIAGSEKSGVTAARAGLFKNHKVILTPLENTDTAALSLVRHLWQCCGAQVNAMDFRRHDEVLAMTSHLPHLLAFSLVDTLAGNPENQDIFRYAAGGFRDFTRIAGSDPIMWHDIALGNSEAIISSLDQFSEGLTHLRQAIVEKDSKGILASFERAQSARQHFASILEKRARMNTLDENQGESLS